MKNLSLILSSFVIITSCSATNGTSSEHKTENTSDATYGYTEKNSIKVGGDQSGPANQRQYLNSLTGPNGEAVSYVRAGSCCHFASRKSAMGFGMLDKYLVTYEGKKDTVTLYLNMYEKAPLKTPLGFKMK